MFVTDILERVFYSASSIHSSACFAHHDTDESRESRAIFTNLPQQIVGTVRVDLIP
jgi:hypothetical protein